MRSVEVVGFERKELGTKYSKLLRAEGNVPCVLYGANDHVHFHVPMYLFKDLVYTPKAAFVNLNIEGKECEAIIQDAQFHPVSEMMLHVDFLKLERGTPITMNIPVRMEGRADGEEAGGEKYLKNKTLRVKALPKNMPEEIAIDITPIQLGKALQVKDIVTKDFEILTNDQVSVVVVNIPRTLRSGLDEDAAAELEEGEEGAEGEEATEAAAE